VSVTASRSGGSTRWNRARPEPLLNEERPRKLSFRGFLLTWGSRKPAPTVRDGQPHPAANAGFQCPSRPGARSRLDPQGEHQVSPTERTPPGTFDPGDSSRDIKSSLSSFVGTQEKVAQQFPPEHQLAVRYPGPKARRESGSPRGPDCAVSACGCHCGIRECPNYLNSDLPDLLRRARLSRCEGRSDHQQLTPTTGHRLS
jgi:hypothetical protein